MPDNWALLREQIAYFSKPFPREAIAFANAHREEVAPYLVEVLAQVAANPAIVIDDPDYILHEYAMHLLAAWADTRAYAPLIALGHWDEETLDAVLGDSVTETYGRCLASVCGGDLEPLKKLFEDTQASHWSRAAGLDAMATRVMEGDASRDDLISYLTQACDEEEKRLLAQSGNRDGLEMLDEVAHVACDLVAVDLMARIRGWLATGLIDRMVLNEHDLDEALRDPFETTRLKVLARGRGYVRDVEAEMGWWASFQDEEPSPKSTRFSGGDFAEPREPEVRSGPKIGRNDPCPCGSGKKYKKCCGAG